MTDSDKEFGAALATAWICSSAVYIGRDTGLIHYWTEKEKETGATFGV